MPWPTTRKPSTRELVRAEHRLLVPRRGRLWLGVLLLALALALGLGAMALYRHVDQQRVAQQEELLRLAAENRALRSALEQSGLRQREAQATEEQLLRRIEDLSTQIERLKTDLAFFRQQKKRQ